MEHVVSACSGPEGHLFAAQRNGNETHIIELSPTGFRTIMKFPESILFLFFTGNILFVISRSNFYASLAQENSVMQSRVNNQEVIGIGKDKENSMLCFSPSHWFRLDFLLTSFITGEIKISSPEPYSLPSPFYHRMHGPKTTTLIQDNSSHSRKFAFFNTPQNQMTKYAGVYVCPRHDMELCWHKKTILNFKNQTISFTHNIVTACYVGSHVAAITNDGNLFVR